MSITSKFENRVNLSPQKRPSHTFEHMKITIIIIIIIITIIITIITITIHN
jgi:hypothetical protein